MPTSDIEEQRRSRDFRESHGSSSSSRRPKRKHYEGQEKRKSPGRNYERRRQEREHICVMGVAGAWGLSPKAPLEDSDNEEEEDPLEKFDVKNNGSVEGVNSKEISNGKYKKSDKKKKRKHKKKRSCLFFIVFYFYIPLLFKKRRKKSSSEESEHDSESDDGVSEWLEKRKDETSGDIVVGPTPLVSLQHGNNDERMDFGAALLPGEGAAMANYVKAGKRIPRRGEIGLTSDEITSFEDQGYVMSGSRHRRMEAVRIRKENQIYSADEKRALAMFNYEERAKRETKILSDFRELVHKKINKQKS
ncbi:NKAP-like protein [Xenia sp. Carnegie-2017]|uniref:NKAP-like protein n=1 Tax=Xenia sp. Carnegie-2017 TaxID=2897299 RepID=UPI001F034C34|nr:NKAP-like protein [Xenia sp. Carnegie-2017]